jgi:hypothetical protein
VLGGLALVVAATDCSAPIAHSGVSSVEELDNPETRAEVREAFGEAYETGPCPDRRTLEESGCAWPDLCYFVFATVIRHRVGLLVTELEEGRCPSWEACFLVFAAELRRSTACVGLPLDRADEEFLHLRQTLAAEVDAGHLAPGDVLAEIEWCPGHLFWGCDGPALIPVPPEQDPER